jgi:hypothetical protein
VSVTTYKSYSVLVKAVSLVASQQSIGLLYGSGICVLNELRPGRIPCLRFQHGSKRLDT